MKGVSQEYQKLNRIILESKAQVQQDLTLILFALKEIKNLRYCSKWQEDADKVKV